MRHAWLVLVAIFFVGCAKPADMAADPAAAETPSGETDLAAGSSEPGMAGPAPSAGGAGTMSLSPDNTKIQFVGSHLREPPDPRTGVFTSFTGRAEIDPDAKQLKSVTVEILTDSLVTPLDGLNTHLKGPDFFDTREYPTAKFESTSVTPLADGQQTITGNLTLLETTEEISFPATVAVGDNGLTLSAEFPIDRMRFGMDYGPENIHKDVVMTVVVGEKTVAPEVAAAPPGGKKGGKKGNFDPVALFARQDADKDGKLTGDEIPAPMQGNLAEIDTDGDGSVSLEEMQARAPARGSGKGGDAGAGDGKAAGDTAE